jgi:hypothetical protein
MADDISKRLAGFIEPFRVSPGSSVKLTSIPASRRGSRRRKTEAPSGAAADPFEAGESGGNRANGDAAVPGTPAEQEG